MQRSRSAAALWGIVLALSAVMPAQAHGVRLSAEVDGQSVSGSLRFADGTAMQQARVVLQASAASTEEVIGWQTWTDFEGHFRFASIPEGDYDIIAQDGLGHRATLRVKLDGMAPGSSAGDVPPRTILSSNEAWQWRDLFAGLGYLTGLLGLAIGLAARRRALRT